MDKETEYYVLKSKLQDLIRTSVLLLLQKKNTKSLFNKETVGGIIVNEYMDCSKWLMDDKGINLMLTNNNIFVWNFTLANLKKLNGIEVELCFHGEYYPNYPPVIKVIKPRLKKSLGYRISNSKMVQLDYWTPTRTVKYIIERTIKILEKYGEIEYGESLAGETKSNKIVNELENLLMKFSSFTNSIIENDEIDSDENFIKFLETKEVKSEGEVKTKKTTEYWKKGTGYGHHGAAKWDINEYVKSQKDKDDKLALIIQNISQLIHRVNNVSNDFKTIIDIIEKSLLIPYLKQQFKNATTLEIHKKENLFKLYLSIIEAISTEKSIYLFDISSIASENSKNDNMYNILEDKK